jgi:HlyD family secretion protein
VKKLLLFLLCAGAALAGVYGWTHLTRTHPLNEKSLTFANLEVVTMRDVVSATGLVEPRELLVVSSEMPGTLARLHARVNDVVAEGTELALLDDRKIALKLDEARDGVRVAEAAVVQARAAVTQATATKDAAQVALKYQEELADKGGFRSDRDQAEAHLRAAGAGVEAAAAGLEMAQAKVQAARTMLRDATLAHELTRIKVPEASPAGTVRREFLVLERKVQEGQMVGPQSGPLFVLAGSLQTVEVHAQVAEGDVNKVRKGLAALFTINTYGDEEAEFRGTVKDVRPLATTVKGAVYYDAVIEVTNQKDLATGEWRLRPGMTASVDLVRREHKNVWRVPSSALNFKMDDAYLGDAARAHLAEWTQRPDAADWQPIWLWDADQRQVRPLFVRVSGTRNGEPGLKDSEGNEVLEWEPGREPSPNQPPRIIFDQPANLKVS